MVYRALQLDLERMVALKVIAPELLDDDDVRKRFLTEARAAASVDHPNVIPVHTAGEDNGIAFIAMRFVAGEDLRSLVRHGGALDAAEAADFVAQAAAALDAIHRAGFVHRDVKPANLLVDPSGHVYLTDFGLAKTVLTHSGGTRTGQWVGTLDYVSPEQIRGGRIDARADVYALGGVLHYALTGRVPFEREGDEAKLWAQLSAPPPVPSEVQPRAARRSSTSRSRARWPRRPIERYPSAGDLGRAAPRRRRRARPVRARADGGARRGRAGRRADRAGIGRRGLDADRSAREAHAPAAATGAGRRRGRRAGGGGRGRGSTAPARRRAERRRLRDPDADFLAVAVAIAVAVADRRGHHLDHLSERGAEDHQRQRPAGRDRARGRRPVDLERAVAVPHARGRRDRPRTREASEASVTTSSAIVVLSGRRSSSRSAPIGRWCGSTAARATSCRGSTCSVTPGRLVGRSPRRLGRRAGPRKASPGWWCATTSRRARSCNASTVREGVGGLLAAGDFVWVVKRTTNKLSRLEPGSDRLVDWTDLTGPGAHDALRRRIGVGGARRRGHGRPHRCRRPPQDLGRGGPEPGPGRPGRRVTVRVEPRRPHGGRTGPGDDARGPSHRSGSATTRGAMVADDRSVWVSGSSDNTLTKIRYR